MSVTQDSVQNICDRITNTVAESYPGLTLHFIVHSTGKMREAVALAEHDLIAHPAGNAARAIVQKNASGERAQFLGLAIAREHKMMGFKKIDHLIGLFTVNNDHFRDETEARAQIYHLIWHAIDLYEIRQDPAYRNKFKTGPMVPKRSPLNLSKANLQADAFAGILSVLHSKDKQAALVKLIAEKRGIMALAQVTDYKAEDFPSVIAAESCEFIIKDLLKNPPAPENTLSVARQVSVDIGRAFDEQNIQQWWDFSIPAQDMAWRGFTKEEILGAAVNTSNNPYVRSIGYLVQEVTKIEPAESAVLVNGYNAFLDPEVNMKLHREMVDTVFEEAISGDDDEDTGRALMEAANKQNEDLTEGRILGWCAHALQDAARAVERAIASGTPPVQAARMQFKGNKHLPDWEGLKDLGNKIVDQRRQGFAITLGHVAEICHNHPAFSPVLDSLKMTMNDPSYVQKLEAANDLAIQPAAPTMAPQGPAPKGPAPKGPAPNAPTPNIPSMPAAAPSFGGSNRGAQIARQRQLMAQKAREEAEADKGDGAKE
jgi:hypothetical protein